MIQPLRKRQKQVRNVKGRSKATSRMSLAWLLSHIHTQVVRSVWTHVFGGGGRGQENLVLRELFKIMSDDRL